VNIYFNYILCITTNPGNREEYIQLMEAHEYKMHYCNETGPLPKGGSYANTSEIHEVHSLFSSDVEEGFVKEPPGFQGEEPHYTQKAPLVEMGFCKKCDACKPPRAHHCHVCDTCVSNMDHHCSWINNCVGKNNVRYFVLFLLYTSVGCLYSTLVATAVLWKDVVGRKTVIQALSSMATPQVALAKIGQSTVAAVFFTSLFVFIAVGVLFVWHLHLVLTAQTTIEYYVNQEEKWKFKRRGIVYINPYDKGWRQNWMQVFGPCEGMGWVMSILPSRRPPPLPIVVDSQWCNLNSELRAV
jgi:hypothetical protein